MNRSSQGYYEDASGWTCQMCAARWDRPLLHHDEAFWWYRTWRDHLRAVHRQEEGTGNG